MIKKIKKALNTSGTTLIETLVSLSLMLIMLTMLGMIIMPAYRVLVRIQRVQSAQIILDNLSEELQSIVKEAEGAVKIYANASAIENQGGVGSGEVLEFVNTDGYVVLVTAAGNPEAEETTLVRGDPALNIENTDFLNGTVKEPKAGRLFSRYYWRKKTETTYNYAYRVDSTRVARALGEAFGEGFYMDHYVKVSFSYPSGIQANDTVTYIKATLDLYDDAAMTHHVTSVQKDLDFRYEVKRYDTVTAQPVTKIEKQ